MTHPPGFAAGADILRSAHWLTRARALRIATVFLVISLAALAWDFKSHTTMGVIDTAGEHLGRDFVNYWSGARLAADGRIARAYDTGFFHDYQRSLVGSESEFKLYSYPPVTAMLTLPLAAFEYVPALMLWLGLGTVLGILLLAATLSWRWAIIAGLASPAIFINAVSGQNGHFSALLLAGGVLLLARRPILAGVLFGTLCYKPHLGLLLPFVLAAGGYWRTFISAGVTVTGLIAASLVLFGPDAWTDFVGHASMQRHLMEQADTFWHRMPTVFAALRIAGADIPVAYFVHALSAIAALCVAVMVWRADCPMAVKGAALVVGTMLVTHYAWDYDLVALTFVVAWLVHDGARTGFLPWEKTVFAMLLAMPLYIGALTSALGLQTGPLVLWFALLLIARRAKLAAPRLSTGAVSDLAF
jgi:hypothetical protein